MTQTQLPPMLTMVTEGWGDYALLDCGHGRKLERYGDRRFIRPEPQAMWAPALDTWDADGEFLPGADEDGGGRWQLHSRLPENGWPLKWAMRWSASLT